MRRTATVLAALGLTAVLAAPVQATDPAPPSEVRAQAVPNIVLILLDDARYDDLSTLPDVRRRIGGAGARFTSFYSPFPLCCPARATLLTGQYAHNHGVLSNKAPTGGFEEFDDSSTLATWLSPTYHTGLIGKYLNQYSPPYQPPGWDEWMVPRSMYSYTGTSWWLDRAKGAGEYRKLRGYQTVTAGRLAADFIDRNAPRARPFFLYTSIVAPHDGKPVEADDPPFPTPSVADRYHDRFEGLASTDPSFNESDVSDKPLRPGPLTKREIAGLTEVNAQRREAELSAQDQVNRILRTLAAAGELQDTYVMFMSDNGYMIGEHRIRGGKVAPYQVANRVPFMVRGPGIEPGTVIRDVTAQIDFAPTVLAMAGANSPRPARIDGINLLPRLTRPSAEPRARPVLLEATETSSPLDPLPWHYRGVVTRQWKYVERVREGTNKELYQLTTDPYELQNLAAREEYADARARLANVLDRLKRCSGVRCR